MHPVATTLSSKQVVKNLQLKFANISHREMLKWGDCASVGRTVAH